MRRSLDRYHPDKNKEEGAEEKFVEIAHGMFWHTVKCWYKLTIYIAYEVLSDATVSMNRTVNVTYSEEVFRNAKYMTGMEKYALSGRMYVLDS
jgi:hypothetical protein